MKGSGYDESLLGKESRRKRGRADDPIDHRTKTEEASRVGSPKFWGLARNFGSVAESAGEILGLGKPDTGKDSRHELRRDDRR